MTYGDGGESPAGRCPLGTAAREALAELSPRAERQPFVRWPIARLWWRPVASRFVPVLHAAARVGPADTWRVTQGRLGPKAARNSNVPIHRPI
jgi:hypothetical protein